MSEIPDFSNCNQTISFQGSTFDGTTNITLTQNRGVPTSRRIDGLAYDLPGKLQHSIIGRNNDMQEIGRRLEDCNRVVITGMAGVGKTTLAVYCARIWHEQDSFPNVAFLHAESKNKIESSFRGLAAKLNIPKEQPVSELLKDSIALYTSTKLLLILDNLERCADVNEFLNLPDNVYILATSQNTELYMQFDCYELTELSEITSVLLMKTILIDTIYKIDDADLNQQVTELCKILQGLPLAITHAASWIKDDATASKRFNFRVKKVGTTPIPFADLYKQSVSQYIDKYKEMLDRPFPDQFITINNIPAFLAIQMNIKKVDERLCGTILNMLGYVDPDLAEIEIFKLIFEEKDLNYKLRELSKFSLIYVDISDEMDGEVEYMRLHRLTQEVIRQIYQDSKSQVVPMIIALASDWKYYSHHEHFLEENFSQTETCNMLATYPLEDLKKVLKQIFTNSSKKQEPLRLLEKLNCDISLAEEWPLLHLVLSTLVCGFYEETVCSMIIKEAPETINEIAGDGITALHVAAASPRNRSAVIDSLLKAGANINATTNGRVTPLQVACAANVTLTIRALVAAGATVDSVNASGDAPLHQAARSFSFRAVHRLVSRGVDINQMNGDGDTALHIVAQTPPPEDLWDLARTLRVLIIHGASLEAVNAEGEKPIAVAAKLHNISVVNWLSNPDELRRQLF